MKKFSTAEFREIARRGERPDGLITREAVSAPTAVESKSRTLRFTFSDGSIDRAGDRIDPNGWDTKSFMKNPVTLWAHDSLSPPIGRASDVHTVGEKLVGDIQFASADEYGFADTIFKLLKGGFLRAVSVGFMPTLWAFSTDPARSAGAIDFKKQQLLEISVCPVPMNANALAEARAKGIDVSDTRLRAISAPPPQVLLKPEAQRRLRIAEANEIAAMARAILRG